MLDMRHVSRRTLRYYAFILHLHPRTLRVLFASGFLRLSPLLCPPPLPRAVLKLVTFTSAELVL